MTVKLINDRKGKLRLDSRTFVYGETVEAQEQSAIAYWKAKGEL